MVKKSDRWRKCGVNLGTHFEAMMWPNAWKFGRFWMKKMKFWRSKKTWTAPANGTASSVSVRVRKFPLSSVFDAFEKLDEICEKFEFSEIECPPIAPKSVPHGQIVCSGFALEGTDYEICTLKPLKTR